MSDITPDVVWLTQEAYDKLEAELDHFKNIGRPEVSSRIQAAREEGDLSENGGYHAAKEEQGQMESRIRQLEHLLETAHVGEPEGDPDDVTPGKVVTVAYDGDPDDTETFLLGSREVLGTDESIEQAVSPQSPLGAAVVGRRVGDKASYDAPNGKTIHVTITAARPL
ncbi:transcription elongation factor GreA [Tessaracoccus antarcticus]|uniref:Transcription elongation factor GreA n=1 Tax=Tessaracoccus antarcticus TaxID=2479848 RepID=A0A3M0GHR1_9ACTN|nr:transcription elongation factor GreA [Tessaracoccus antarcticus]RMB62202.1 transcription elongation factor GreA [Tessaracoccus antarcticus]